GHSSVQRPQPIDNPQLTTGNPQLMKLGAISDTHGHFDPKLPKLFAGVDHILHGGDIGLPWLILELEQIAPVTAVLGNTDAGLDFKETEVAEFDGRKFLVHHIVDPRSEERRVGKECRSRWSTDNERKTTATTDD